LDKGVQDSTFSSLLQAIVSSLVQTPTSSSSLSSLSGHPALSSLSSTAALDCSRSLFALFTDFARCNVSGASASGALEESGLSPGKALTFSSVYAAALPGLRESLSTQGDLFLPLFFKFPRKENLTLFYMHTQS
jgi:hypothetical protein